MSHSRCEVTLGLLLCVTASAQAEPIRQSLTFEGEQRPYWLYIPDAYDGSEAWPLVINMHGAGSNGSEQMSLSGMNHVADASRFMVVYPQALGELVPDFGVLPMWNDRDWGGEPDDVGFIAHLIGEMESQYNVNSRRIYATGFSQGSAMSYAVGAELSDKIAAIAPISGPNVFNPTAARPLPILLMHGTADEIAPIDGGVVPIVGARLPPLAEILTSWQTINGCGEEAIATSLPNINLQDDSTVTRHDYPSCRTYVTADTRTVAAELIYYEIDGGGHTWPDGPTAEDTVNRDINASEEIWAFFSRHELPLLPLGDFDGSGNLGLSDIDALGKELRSQLPRRVFDVDGNSIVDATDHRVWVTDLFRTWVGDSNLDGEFNSADLTAVLAAGQYDDDIDGNSGWATGDWNADGDFTSADLVVALADGGFGQGPRAAAASVPEPASAVLLLVGAITLLGRRIR